MAYGFVGLEKGITPALRKVGTNSTQVPYPARPHQPFQNILLDTGMKQMTKELAKLHLQFWVSVLDAFRMTHRMVGITYTAMATI